MAEDEKKLTGNEEDYIETIQKNYFTMRVI